MSDEFSTTRLYVGNLEAPSQDSTGQDDTEAELINLFMAFGEIHDYTKKSDHGSGFMFLEYMIPEQASAALQSMHKYEYKGRRLIVQFARKRNIEKKKEANKKKELERYLQAGGMSSWVRGQEVPSTRAAETSSHSQGDYNGWTAGAGGASGYQVGGDYSSAPPPSYANPYGSGTGEGGGYDTSKQKPMSYGYTTGQPTQQFNNAPVAAQPPSYPPPGPPQHTPYPPPGAPQHTPYPPPGAPENTDLWSLGDGSNWSYGKVTTKHSLQQQNQARIGGEEMGSNPVGATQQSTNTQQQYGEELPEYTTDKWSLLDAAKWYDGKATTKPSMMHYSVPPQNQAGGNGGEERGGSNHRDRSSEKTRDRSNQRNRWDNDMGRSKDQAKKPSSDVPMDTTSPPAQANDVEIVCQSQEYTNYAEWIEEKLGTKGLKVDILYPNPEITLVHLLSNISARKGIFAIVVNADSRERRCFDMYVLQGELQEHKNMPETEALNYIVRNYSKLSSKLTGKIESAERPNFGITSEISRIFLDIRDDRDLDIAAYDKAIQYLVHNREGLLKDEYGSRVPTHLLIPPCTPAKESMLRGKQEEVQEYILEILNKNPDILTQTKEMPKIKLSEPTISSSNNMQQATTGVNHNNSAAGNHQPVIGGNNMGGMNMNDMGKLFGMMQNIMKNNPSMFNS